MLIQDQPHMRKKVKKKPFKRMLKGLPVTDHLE